MTLLTPRAMGCTSIWMLPGAVPRCGTGFFVLAF
jgi:hypothetical protein